MEEIKQVRKLVENYFENVPHDDLVKFSEFVGDMVTDWGSGFHEAVERFFEEESCPEMKALVDEDMNRFMTMYILDGVVDGWVIDYICNG